MYYQYICICMKMCMHTCKYQKNTYICVWYMDVYEGTQWFAACYQKDTYKHARSVQICIHAYERIHTQLSWTKHAPRVAAQVTQFMLKGEKLCA